MLAQVRRAVLAPVGRFAPDVLAAWFERQFLTPGRRAHRAEPPPGGEATRLPYGDGWLVVRAWGSGPAVLLLHGWSGDASDMHAFVRPLVDAGLRAVAFDAPAHGGSSGLRTNLVACAGAALLVGRTFGPVRGVIAHSFGGPTAALAAAHGLAPDRLVLIGVPADLRTLMVRSAARAGIPSPIVERTNVRVALRLRVDWNALRTDTLLRAADRPLLVIHDRGDRVVPWTHGAAIAGAARRSRLLTTTGLGHDWIPDDYGVVAASVGFLSGHPA